MQPELFSLLRAFIAFRTVPGNNAEKKACLDWIQETFFSASVGQIERGEAAGSPYLYLRHPDPQLLWFAHIDVVPGADAQFTLALENDKALGRGVKDMKGAALTFLLAFRDHCAQGKIPPVSVLLTSDEEVGGMSLVALHDEKKFPGVPVAFTPDTGEHPGIVTELKGAVWARLICDGNGAHGGMPWLGKNPIPMLADAIAQLTRAFPIGTADDWQMTVTPTQLHGSDAINKIPDEAQATLDIRFPGTIHATPEQAIGRVRQVLPQNCRIEPKVIADPLSTDPNHPMVQRIKRIAEAVLGMSIPFHREHGSSDARAFGAHGIPSFLYGPEGGDLHGAGEWASLSSLQQHVELNRLLLAELEREAK